MENDAIQLKDVTRVFGAGDRGVTALDRVSPDFPRGTFTAVMGPSGSGKSTLLQCAAGLDRPTSGSVRVGGTELGGLGETRLTLLRRDRIGFVFQAFNLLPALTAEQNVALPLRLAGATRWQVLRLVAGESLLVVLVGTVTGTLVAALNLAGVRAAPGLLDVRSALIIPWGALGATSGACAAVAVVSAVVPAALCLRRRAVEMACVRD
ncbi:ATP-binding cassette domain-containing protein [Streptomyces sp. NPDC001549]|uniref:ATP-binding cassette domain-containing protein n=1 Tax=Streptomyces sp. NPDC001549 TaxID=3364586 RepID=UPI0036A92CEC